VLISTVLFRRDDQGGDTGAVSHRDREQAGGVMLAQPGGQLAGERPGDDLYLHHDSI
jgi:hypothetical protein